MIVLCAGVETIIGPLLYSALFHHGGINNPVERTQEIIPEISPFGSETMMPQANAGETQQP